MQNKPPSVSVESLARRHEAYPPHLRNPLIVLASVALMICFCLALPGALIWHFTRTRAMQPTQPLGIIAAPNLQPLARFLTPRLQMDDDHAQMSALRAAQNAKLNGYAWVDRSSQTVRIPIARAMDLLLQKGLPAQTNGILQTAGSPEELIRNIPQPQ